MKPKSLAVFAALIAAEAVGAAIILWQGLPIYHYLLDRGPERRSDLIMRLLAIAGITIIQVAYWTAWRWFRRVELPSQVVLGHVLQFVARLNFVFVSGMFAAAYLIRSADMEFRPSRFLLLTSALFSMFCFTLELERLGRAFVEGKASRREPASRGDSHEQARE